jgi:hypothetical protein
MSKLLKRFLNGFFSLNNSEQKGIIVLAVLIVLLVVANQFLPILLHQKEVNQADYLEKIKAFKHKQQEIADSVYLARKQAKGKLDSAEASKLINPFLFNPNQLPDSSWLALGLSEKQVATIKNYEAKGGKFNNKEDFRKIYGISEGEFLVLEPFLEIPETKQREKPAAKRPKVVPQTKQPKAIYSSIELNGADSALLVERLRFPP